MVLQQSDQLWQGLIGVANGEEPHQPDGILIQCANTFHQAQGGSRSISYTARFKAEGPCHDDLTIPSCIHGEHERKFYDEGRVYVCSNGHDVDLSRLSEPPLDYLATRFPDEK